MSTDPLDSKAEWDCDTCKKKINSEEICDLIAKLEAEVEILPTTKEALEEELIRLKKYLHPNHCIMLDVKFTLVQLYGRQRLNLYEEMMFEARRKKQLCQDVLDGMEMIIRGKFRLRGMFLFELYVVSLYEVKQEQSAAKLKKEEFRQRLRSLRPILDECIEILSWEPQATLEGERCAMAKDYIVRLDAMIKC